MRHGTIIQQLWRFLLHLQILYADDLQHLNCVKSPTCVWSVTLEYKTGNTNLSLLQQRTELQASSIFDGMEISQASSSRHWTKWRRSGRISGASGWNPGDFPTSQPMGRKSSVQRGLLQQHSPWTLCLQLDPAGMVMVTKISIKVVRL